VNAWQITRQLKRLLLDRKWEGLVASELVFNECLITQAIPDDQVPRLGFPFAQISLGTSSSDDSEPTLKTLELEITLVARNLNDTYGEASMIGGARGGGQASSSGRGILEVAEEAEEVLAQLQRDSGVRNIVRGRGIARAVYNEQLGYLVSLPIQVEAWGSLGRSYEEASRFTAVDAAGSGDVDLAWTLPPPRFDRVGVQIQRAAGSTPPSSPTSGTTVSVPSPTDTAFTDSPGVGPFSYALFGSYDEIGSYTNAPATPDRYSGSVTATVTAT